MTLVPTCHTICSLFQATANAGVGFYQSFTKPCTFSGQYISLAQRKASMIKSYHGLVRKIKAAPEGTFSDKTLNDFLVFLKQYSTSVIMAYDILAENRGASQKMNDALNPLRAYIPVIKALGVAQCPKRGS